MDEDMSDGEWLSDFDDDEGDEPEEDSDDSMEE